MKSIYILLTKSNTAVSKLIHFVTDDPYTHISLSFEENLTSLYSFSRKYSNLPLPAGLREESLTDRFYKKQSQIPCALYELKVSDAVYQIAKEEVAQMMAEKGKYRYSIIGLFLCGFNIPFHRQYRYFCSEFVSEVLIRSKAVSLPKVPSLMRPNDYTKISNFSRKFQGPLKLLQLC